MIRDRARYLCQTTSTVSDFAIFWKTLQNLTRQMWFDKDSELQIRGDPDHLKIKKFQKSIGYLGVKRNNNPTFDNEFEFKRSKWGIPILTQIKDFFQTPKWNHWWEYLWDHFEKDWRSPGRKHLPKSHDFFNFQRFELSYSDVAYKNTQNIDPWK